MVWAATALFTLATYDTLEKASLLAESVTCGQSSWPNCITKRESLHLLRRINW
jgi:hypothetical protein